MAAVCLNHDRCGERPVDPAVATTKTIDALGVILLLDLALPKCAPAQLVETVQRRVRAGAVVQNTNVPKQNRRGAVAPDVFLRAKVTMPKLLTIEVVGGHTGGGVVGHHHPPISHRRPGAVGIRFVGLFRLGVLHALLPKQRAVFLVETHHGTLFVRLRCLCDEHLVAPDDRCAVAPVRQRHTPADVLFRVPLQREFPITHDAGSGEVSPPRRPVSGL